MNKLSTTIPDRSMLDNYCSRCGKQLAPQDNFCRHCGAECHQFKSQVDLVPATVITAEPASNETAVTANSATDTVQTILNNRIYVFGIMALIGPLGLPALWFSPRFSKQTKILSTLFFILMTTVVPLVVAWYYLDYSLRPLVEAFGQRP